MTIISRDDPARQASGPAVDVVVPVWNEVEMLPAFLARMAALPQPVRLIFVDNGSTDGTLELLRARPELTLLEHGQNLGYGQSLVDGMRLAEAPLVVIIDADCEYPPEAIGALLEKLQTATVVYTSRFLDPSQLDMSPTRQLGNRFVSLVFNLLYGQGVTDLYTGMKAFRREAYDGIDFTRSGFEHVVELAARLARRGHRIAEVPIAYRPRQTGRSKMKHIPEAAKALWLLVKYRFDHA